MKKFLKPGYVYINFREKIKAFQSIIAEAKPLINTEKSTSLCQLGDDLIDVARFSHNVTVKEHNLIPRTGKNAMPQQSIVFSCSPYELSLLILEIFTKKLERSLKLKTNIEKIVAMVKAAEDVQAFPDCQALSYLLKIDGSASPFFMEADKNSPINVFYQQNKQIAESSDISIRFDESYFMLRGDNSVMQIPTSSIFDENERYMYYNLSHRTAIRDYINLKMSEKRVVVINGVSYCSAQFEGRDCLETKSESYQEIANLTGMLIINTKQPIFPNEWATREVELINLYRLGGSAIDTILSVYDMGTFNGFPTKCKQIEQVEYSLDKKRLSF